jgi:hypothetical protein
MDNISDFCRFMLLTEIGKEKGACWEWKGSRPGGKYGHFSFEYKAVKAHRWIYEKIVGEIPSGLLVRHKCDNPGCVNPDHLEVGTQAENVSDMYERCRAHDRKGQNHPMSRLTAEDVVEIRRLRDCGATEASVAAKFGIGRGQVGKIHRRENWGHV